MNIERLKNIHGILKNHPYRLYFIEEDEEDYRHQLLELSNAWGDIIYTQKHDEETTKKLKQFGNWIHDYNSILCRRKGYDDFTNYFTYYEAMLQLTHSFIDTGDFDAYYYPTVRKGEDGNLICSFDKYVYVTRDECKIDSKYVPGYFCITTKYNTDDEPMMNIFRRYFKDELVAKEKFSAWSEQEKPVWEYMNHRQDKSKKEEINEL